MADQDIPAMDYPEHERTYHHFIEVSKVGLVATIHVLVCILILTRAATGLGIAFGIFLLVAGLVAASAGMFSKSNGWAAPLVLLGLALVQMIYISA